MASQGPLNPTAASQDSSGTVSWSTPTGIEGISTFATQSEPQSTSNTTNKLIGTGFGFAIPAGTINGITVSYDATVSSTVSYTNEPVQIQLLKASAAVGTPKTDTNNWTTSVVTYTYGGVSDLWGTTWSASDINGSGFGFQINDVPDHGATGLVGRVQSVQNYKITVTYTAAAAHSPTSQSFTFGF